MHLLRVARQNYGGRDVVLAHLEEHMNTMQLAQYNHAQNGHHPE